MDIGPTYGFIFCPEKVSDNCRGVFPQPARLLKKERIDEEAISVLHYYLAVQSARVPAFRNAVEAAEASVIKKVTDMLMSDPERLRKALASLGERNDQKNDC